MDAGSDTLYTAEQIRIPPDLPDILKNYTKHIIRTQPGNIVKESVEYFGRLAKQRSDGTTLKRLNNMQLEALYNKFDQPGRTVVKKAELEDACNSFTISAAQVNDVLRLGGWGGDKIPWLKCWALFVTSSAGSLPATIETVANLLSDNGRTRIEPVVEVLQYLAEQDKTVNKVQVNEVVQSLMANSFDCPVEQIVELVRAELQPGVGAFAAATPALAPAPAGAAAPVAPTPRETPTAEPPATSPSNPDPAAAAPDNASPLDSTTSLSATNDNAPPAAVSDSTADLEEDTNANDDKPEEVTDEAEADQQPAPESPAEEVEEDVKASEDAKPVEDKDKADDDA